MMRILIIEDEAVLRNEVVEWLNLEGYEAEGAADGRDGVTEAKRRPPDLILCDLAMPRLDGYGVLTELRAHAPTAAIPIIFVTAKASDDDIFRGLESGACNYITKPFKRLELLNAIQQTLAS